VKADCSWAEETAPGLEARSPPVVGETALAGDRKASDLSRRQSFVFPLNRSRESATDQDSSYESPQQEVERRQRPNIVWRAETADNRFELGTDTLSVAERKER